MSWTTVLRVLSAKCTQAYTYKYSKMRRFGSVKQGLPPSLWKDPQDKLGESRRCLDLTFDTLDIYLEECFAYFAHNYVSVEGESHFSELLFVAIFFIWQPLICFAADPWTLLDWHVTVRGSSLEVKPKRLHIHTSAFYFKFQCVHSAGKCCPCCILSFLTSSCSN